MPAFEIHHDDPRPVARAAALRSPSERDPATRAHGRALSMPERLRAGFALSSFASRLLGTAGR